MAGRLLSLLATPLILCGCATGAVRQDAAGIRAPAAADAGAEVLRREREWLDAYERRDPVAMAEILADEFLITYPNGRMLSKAAVVAQMERMGGASSSRFSTQEVQARDLGGAVVVTGVLTMESPRGTSRQRYTDTWVRRDGRWQVVASHLSELPD